MIKEKDEVINMNDVNLDDFNTDTELNSNNNSTKYDKPGAIAEKDQEPGCRLFGYRPSKIKWSNVVFLTVMHTLAVYGYYHCITFPIKALTVTFIYIISCASGVGLLSTVYL